MIWLEAQQFENLGGWVNDAQFLDQMGSPYLLAVGLGKPVQDAETRIVLPKAGRYRLWVRCRDWVPEQSPGRFQVLLDGKAVAHTFGASGRNGWVWEDGGTLDLDGGETTVCLHDLTGYYGRCDALLLVDDLSYRPPDDRRALDSLRRRYGGVSREERYLSPYDIVVVGGGLAGCFVAVSAARQGCRVALIHNRPVLGGNASTECLVPPVGVWPYGEQDPLDPRETGIVEEIRTDGRQTDENALVYSDRLWRLCRAESNLDLYMDASCTGVEMEANTIAAVKVLQVKTGRRLVFPARLVVDCTGDGSVGVAAGAEFRHGREPRSMHNEHPAFAPESGDSYTMGCGLKYISTERSRPVPFEAPPWAHEFTECTDLAHHPPLDLDYFHWQFQIEIGSKKNTVDDAEEIRDELLCIIYGLWDHIKNHCSQLQELATNRELTWVGHVLAKRESRRLIGDYVMTEPDVSNGTLFPDRIAYSTWGLDVHPPDMFYVRFGSGVAVHLMKGTQYSIPFRSLYSKDVENLMMVGRNISVSHVALGGTRLMLTHAIMGQAVGTAARLCLQYDTTPRGIYQEHIGELQQQLLKDGCYLVDLANQDPRDLARCASVTASSTRIDEEREEIMGPERVIDGYARAEHGTTHSWRPGQGQPLPQWVELNLGQPTSFNSVHVSFQTKDHAAESFQIEIWDGDQWQMVVEVSANKMRRRVICFDRRTSSKVRLVLTNAPEDVAVCQVRIYDDPAE